MDIYKEIIEARFNSEAPTSLQDIYDWAEDFVETMDDIQEGSKTMKPSVLCHLKDCMDHMEDACRIVLMDGFPEKFDHLFEMKMEHTDADT